MGTAKEDPSQAIESPTPLIGQEPEEMLEVQPEETAFQAVPTVAPAQGGASPAPSANPGKAMPTPNRPGKQGARCTYMQHQVIGFNPDECSCNGGPMTPSRCMEYARDYIAKRYPNQEIVIVLHEERCRSDGSARFAAHLAINRTDLETGRRLNDGPARAAAKSRVRTVKELDTKYGLSQLERGLSNSKVHARQPGREEREMAKKGRSDKSENARVRAIVAQRAEEVGRLKSCPDRFGEFARRLESDGIEIARSKRGALQYHYHSESLGKTRKINGARLGYAVNRSTGRIMRFTARGIDLAIRAAWELARESIDGGRDER